MISEIEFCVVATNQKSFTKGSLQVRQAKHEIHQRINSNLHIEFAKQDISSLSGLELFRRYLKLIGLHVQIQRAFRGTAISGDYGVVDMMMVFFALWLAGARRLRQIPFIAEDPLVKRLCGLHSLPSDRTVSRWLTQFTNDSLQVLIELNSQIVCERLQKECLTRVTLDFDGTVLSCGDKVKWAARGYNPQNRHSKSLYPLLCHVAQTGQFLKIFNRPGDVHDSRRAVEMIRSCVEEVRRVLPHAVIEARLDSAFFQEAVLKYLLRENIEFVVKVPMWRWLCLKEMMMFRQRWHHASERIHYFHEDVVLDKWDLTLNMTFYRQKLSDEPKKGYQLDLFTPDDGIYEHFVLLSNKTVTPGNLLDFYNGRCNMEHNIAEIKGEFGFDVIPCRDYQGNSAHQLISSLCYNVIRNFQRDISDLPKRPATASRTHLWEFQSLKTIRFELIQVAGRLLNSNGYKTLRLANSSIRKLLFENTLRRLDQLESEKRSAA